jgi:hypothetical protein
MTVHPARPNPTAVGPNHDPYAGDRTGTILGVAAGALGGGAVLYFWLMGAINLLAGTGGFILELGLAGLWRTLYLAYPIVFLVAALVGGLLFLLKRDLEAVGVMGLPVVAAIAYYFALVHLRPI